MVAILQSNISDIRSNQSTGYSNDSSQLNGRKQMLGRNMWIQYIPKWLMRKMMHLWIFLIFIFGVDFPLLVAIAGTVVFMMFMFFEVARHNRLLHASGSLLSTLSRSFSSLTDEKDMDFALSHIYLLIAALLPLTLASNSEFMKWTGVISVVIGDGMAAIGGIMARNRKILPSQNHGPSLAGFMCFFCASLLASVCCGIGLIPSLLCSFLCPGRERNKEFYLRQ
ncbi:Polyprenol kinase family like protein [Aduncisulcus paluster]|uniref:dolichol kinase n=1 Tax=Aduncisulcus paluster TaxID=2918883 RepID=A0ABQ5KSN0_9EUKA|nr:Polyprenol kinase family like protein [Aduncisulcus paluster]